jgi:hypothetical protein
MKNWMASLVSHYETMRTTYPQEKLLIVFDIDGTILDMRHLVLYALKSFDKKHKTEYFKGIHIADIDFHEDRLALLLERLKIPIEDRSFIVEKYEELLVSSTSIIEAHQPFRGVLEVIRWFQLQPNTFVGLNTGRPELLRFNTLQSLNKLGVEYRVVFRDDLLYMKPPEGGSDIPRIKAQGVEYFQNLGFRVFAVVDNEPENLNAISRVDWDHEILLLHADTIFISKGEDMPRHVIRGKDYNIAKLISQKNMPKHIQFIWYCDNTRENFDTFIRSNIHWVEIDLRGVSLFMKKPNRGDGLFNLDECLNLAKQYNKGIKLDLHGGGILIGRIIDMINDYNISNSHLCFQGSVVVLGENGFRMLRMLYPDAILQCPIDFLAPMIDKTPEQVKKTLLTFQAWGINRFVINWSTPRLRHLFSNVHKWGFAVDLGNITNLVSFLRATLLLPDSITSHFNYPAWSCKEDKQTGAETEFRRIA